MCNIPGSFDLKECRLPRLKTDADNWASGSGYSPHVGSLRDMSFSQKAEELVEVSIDLAKLDDVIKANKRGKHHSNHGGSMRDGVKIDKWRPLAKDWKFQVD